MHKDKHPTIEDRLAAIENKIETVQALLLSLAEKTGFKKEDMTEGLDSYRKIASVMDPGPGEVDPEQ